MAPLRGPAPEADAGVAGAGSWGGGRGCGRAGCSFCSLYPSRSADAALGWGVTASVRVRQKMQGETETQVSSFWPVGIECCWGVCTRRGVVALQWSLHCICVKHWRFESLGMKSVNLLRSVALCCRSGIGHRYFLPYDALLQLWHPPHLWTWS